MSGHDTTVFYTLDKFITVKTEYNNKQYKGLPTDQKHPQISIHEQITEEKHDWHFLTEQTT